MMHDSYWFGYNVPNLLIKGWDIQSVGGFSLLCVFLVCSAGLFEAVKLCQITVKLRALLLLVPNHLNLFCFPNDQSSLLNNEDNSRTNANKDRVLYFVCEVLLYVGQVFIGYVMMLVVMTYNVYFTVAMATGAGLGYFLFGFQCDQTKMKMVKLKVPCQQCLHNTREDSAASTVLESDNVPVSDNSNTNVDLTNAISPHCSQLSTADVHDSNNTTA